MTAKWMVAALGAAAMLCSTPASAQDRSYKLGPLWTAARIKVEPGQFENYMDWLTKVWIDNQAFAKSQGWLLDYHILDSVNPRDGEPDLILITRYADFPTVAEIERRDAIMNQRMNQTARTAEKASGERAVMRRQMGSVLYRELLKR